MKLSAFDVVGVLVVVVWLAWIGLYVADDWGLTPQERIELTPQEIEAGFREGEEWQGIYLKDQKVGYLRLEKRKIADGYELESSMVLHLTVMKTRQRIDTEFVGQLDREFVLRTFEVTIDSGPAHVEIRGKIDGLVANLTIDSGGSSQTQKLELKEPPRLFSSLKAFVTKTDLSPGDEHRLTFFDPLTMVERDVVITYIGDDELEVMGANVRALHLTQRIDDVEHHVWTNEIGEVLKEELPMGLIGVREPETEARYGVSTGTYKATADVVDAVAVTPTGPPFKIYAPSVSLELSGLDFEGLHMNGGRQQWSPTHDGTRGRLDLKIERLLDVRELSLTDLAAQVEASEDESVTGALGAEMLVQSDHPRLISQAHKIVGDESNALDVVRLIADWVFETLEKESVIGVPSALEVLTNLRGDCNEHATLATALLRAIGVPARTAAGIAYLDTRGRFFYHAWVEVWLGQWIAIDPTFDQLPADIGHIRFVAGSLREQMAMFRVIGKVNIRVEGAE